MNRLSLLLVLIVFSSCGKESAPTPNLMSKFTIYKGRIVASDSRINTTELSGIVKNGDYFNFMYFQNSIRKSCNLPFTNHELNDSTRILYSFYNEYFFDTENGQLFFLYRIDTVQNGEFLSTNSPQFLAEINVEDETIGWIRQMGVDCLYTLLGTFQNKLQVIRSEFIAPDYNVFFMNYNVSDGMVNDSTFNSSLHGNIVGYSNNGNIFLVNEDGYINFENRVWKFDNNFNLISDYLISSPSKDFLPGFLYDDQGSNVLLPISYFEYSFISAAVNLSSSTTSYIQSSIANKAYACKYHKLNDGRYIALGFSTHVQNDVTLHDLEAALLISEYDPNANVLISYKTYTYFNTLDYINSIYLGEKNIQVLANTSTLYESQQNHIVFEIDLDNLPAE